MMHIKVNKSNAELARKFIIKNNLLDNSFIVQHDDRDTYFPISNNIYKANIKKLLKNHNFEIIDIVGKKRDVNDYYKLINERIGPDITIDTGYDALGNIGIIDPRHNSDKKVLKTLALCILDSNSNLKTVLAKNGPVNGIYRTRRLSYIAGERKYIASYKENGATFIFDVRRTFFSTRLSFERSRLMKLSKNNECVMVLFAGIGPFAIEIAKKNLNSNIIGIEINPYAYKNMIKNIKLNNTKNVHAVLGDVKKIYKKYASISDRIIMPLPKTSYEFLDEAFFIAKDNCIVHLYAFVEIDGGFDKFVKKLQVHAKNNGYGVEILFHRVVRPYSALEEEIVIDYRIKKH